MRDPEYSPQVVEHLLGSSDLVLTGTTSWQPHGTRTRATWLLEGGPPDFDFHLEFGIANLAPAAYTIGLRLEDDPLAVHLDVRGVHKQPDDVWLEGVSHLQDFRTGDLEGWADVPPPDPPFWRAALPEVTGGEYFENLRAFCTYMQIAMVAFRWEEPDCTPRLAETLTEGAQ